MSTKRSSADTVPIFHAGDVAEKVGVARQTIYNWLEAGLIRASYRVGGDDKRPPMFTAADVEKVKQVKQQRELDRKQAMNLLRLPEAR